MKRIRLIYRLCLIMICGGYSASTASNDIVISSYLKALEANPEDIDIHYQLASAYYNRKSYYEAIYQYQIILNYNPDELVACFNIALINYNLQEFEKALEFFRRAQELNPSDKNLYYVIGMCHYSMKQYESAIDFLQKAANFNPENIDAKINLGNAYSHTERFEEAVRWYKESLKSIEVDSFVIRNLGYALYNTGLKYLFKNDFAKALSFLEEAVKYVPDKQMTHLALANAEFNQQHFAKAVYWYNKVIEINTDIREVYYCRAYSYLRLGELEKARRDFDRVLQFDPTDKDALKYYAVLLNDLFANYMQNTLQAYEKKDYFEAWLEIQKAASIDSLNENLKKIYSLIEKEIPGFIEKTLIEAQSLCDERDYAGCYRKYRMIAALDSGRSDVKSSMARVSKLLDKEIKPLLNKAREHERNERLYAALQLYRTIFKMKPDYPGVKDFGKACQKKLAGKITGLYRDALYYYEKQDYITAINKFESILKIDPSFIDSTGNIAQAHTLLAAGEEKRQKEIQVTLQQGIEYMENSHFFEARELFSRVLELDSSLTEAKSYIAQCEQEIQNQIDKYMAIAREQYKQKNFMSAQKYFKRIAQLAPKLTEAKLYAGKCSSFLLMEQGDKLLAQGDFQDALKKYLSSIEMDGENEEARRKLNSTQESRDRQINEMMEKGRELMRVNRLYEAEKTFKLILQNYASDHGDAAFCLGQIKAAKSGRGLSEKVDSHYSKGVAYYTSGEYDKAIEEWEVVLQLDPSNGKAAKNIENARKKLKLITQ